MSLIDSTIAEFGQSMGFTDLGLDKNGVVCLEFETSGALTIERIDGGALMFLTRPFDRFREGVLEAALGLCHHKYNTTYQPRVGLTADGLLSFALRLEEADLHVASLERALDFLNGLYAKLEG